MEQTDGRTNTVTYSDANVVYNSLDTEICAPLPLNSLKNAKKAKWDRQMDGPTDQHVWLIEMRMWKNEQNCCLPLIKYLNLHLSTFKELKEQKAKWDRPTDQPTNRPTDQPTDRQTDRVTYRSRCPRQKCDRMVVVPSRSDYGSFWNQFKTN